MTVARVSPDRDNWGFWNWDMKRDRLYGDPVTERYFSLTPGQASLGAPLEDYLRAIHSDDRDRVIAAIKHAVDDGSDYEQRYRVLRSDGLWRTIVASGYCITDDEGVSVHYPGMFVDITEDDDIASADVKALADHLLSARDIAERAGLNNVGKALTDLVSEVGFLLANTLRK